MKLSDMKTVDQAIREHRQDAEFRDEWDRTAFARQVATRVVEFRSKHKLTQQALAKLTGLKQPAIARLESGDHEPSLATLAKLTLATGLTFEVTVSSGHVDLDKVWLDPKKRTKVSALPVRGRHKRVKVFSPQLRSKSDTTAR